MSQEKVKILVLAADAPSLARLNLGEEVRRIDREIWDSAHRDRFKVESELAVRQDEIIKLLIHHRPNVVHFSGHASKKGQIFLLSDDGKHLPVSAETLKAIFAEFVDTVRLVFFNACDSGPEAEAVAEIVGCAVGTAKEISDRAAIAFAACFYDALANGLTVGQAYKLGTAQLMIKGWQEEAEVKLLTKKGIDAYGIRLFETESSESREAVQASRDVETDPTGRVYLSFGPSRMSETKLIASALRDRGIPLCEEALSEEKHLMDGAITDVLRSPGTSGGLIFLTPDAVRSDSVKRLEVPEMLDRAKPGNKFFIVATAVAGFDSGEVGTSLRSRRIQIGPIERKTASPAHARAIARRVLEERITAIDKSLTPVEPLRLELYTKAQAPFKQGTALLMDWTPRFGTSAAVTCWEDDLLPALRDIAEVIGAKAPGRSVQADGRPSLPAAIALGSSFMQTRGISIGWGNTRSESLTSCGASTLHPSPVASRSSPG